MRYVLVVLDLSRAAMMTDWRPTRAVVITRTLRQFVPLFFEQNPLSKLGVMLLRNGMAEQLTDLTSSPVRRRRRQPALAAASVATCTPSCMLGETAPVTSPTLAPPAA